MSWAELFGAEFPEEKEVNEGVEYGPTGEEFTGTDEDGQEFGTIEESSRTYGPKTVKTPNMEVTQFDPITIQKAKERSTAVTPTIGSLDFQIAAPNISRYQPSHLSRRPMP